MFGGKGIKMEVIRDDHNFSMSKHDTKADHCKDPTLEIPGKYMHDPPFLQ
jgi:hypothetical protein